MKRLPLDYIERMKRLLGCEYADYERAVNEPPVKGFRVNTDKISLEDFEKINIFGSQKIPYVQNGYYLDFEKVGNHPFHHAGMIYVQEPAAMAPAECIDINPDSKILDMCAAPGGKSTQLKNKLGKNGMLVSNEIIPSRCKILTGNIERLGLKNCVTTCMDSARLAAVFKNTFDVIMVDAPCSGEGMFRKEQAAIDEWSSENVNKCACRQAEILENAAKCLASGGYIIYATCTFSLEENEMTVDKFLKLHSEFEIIPVKSEVQKATSDGIKFDGCACENIHFARRFYPHKAKGEGQFMAVLRHKGDGDFIPNKPKEKPVKTDPAVIA
ncbi:MAG: RsmB/NOP family class I SAM-dependent RNA methyltransferase, partial [Acutalibacteraceae bacterium]